MSQVASRAGSFAALGAAVVLGLTSLTAAAAVPVEESVGNARPSDYTTMRQASPAPGSGAIDTRAMDSSAGDTGQSSRLGELFYQLQVLQQEVQDLRGLVEEQNYRLERLARDQQEQYLDLDRRMQALRGGGAATSPASAGEPGSGVAVPGGGRSPAPGPTAGSMSEREAYTAAFDLMKQRQFDASAAGFRALIQNFPNGAYTPNAFYWLGELQLAQDDVEAARQSFAQVVNLYPDHQKVPDALYKLGVVYHRLGDVARAREYLNQVRRDFPQSSAAGLAQTYLAEL
ncbi:MAG: tol-pal system protein YbgF [Pseudomonadales bacterium]